MKSLALATLLLFPLTATAAPDYFITWSIGSGLSNNVSVLELEATIGTKYIAANGALITAQGAHAPVTGTCFQLSTNGIFCSLTSNGRPISVTTDPALNGTITERDTLGAIVATTTVQISSVK